MSRAKPWIKSLLVVGFVGLILGAADPLEGSVVILPAAGATALAAILGKSRHRALLVTALVFIAGGIAALWAISTLGGVGGDTGRSMGWAIVMAPYPIGWLLAVAGGILALIESFKHRTAAV